MMEYNTHVFWLLVMWFEFFTRNKNGAKMFVITMICLSFLGFVYSRNVKMTWWEETNSCNLAVSKIYVIFYLLRLMYKQEFRAKII
jgi:hypothetical protein